MLTRAIPHSGEALPVLGLGTFRAFDQTLAEPTRQALTGVLQTLFDAGGSLIDSSPMYGRAEGVTGELLEGMKGHSKAFLATKVWTRGKREGERQMTESLKLMRAPAIALMQVHNLTDTETHLATLRDWKAKGRVRYLGITHYTAGAFDALEKVLRAHPEVDFCQFPYSLVERAAESRLLPVCAELGVATLINRPFGQDELFARVAGKTLPGWAAAAGCTNWSHIALKYVLGDERVTNVIPATSKPHHMTENLKALDTPLPDAPLRRRMADLFKDL
jgi:aryl-alcohol dehydrogenase-like predicted oxidoreductase